MDRPEYLKMCQKISMLKHGLCGIKENIPPELLVKCIESKYYPIGYKMLFNKGKCVHMAILHDLNTHSVLEVGLDKIFSCNNQGKE